MLTNLHLISTFFSFACNIQSFFILLKDSVNAPFLIYFASLLAFNALYAIITWLLNVKIG